MDYRNLLKNNLSRNLIDNIALTVYDDVANFQTVFDLIFDKDEKVAWRAAWACEKMIQKFPEFIDEIKKMQITNLALTTKYEGIRRLSLSILLSLPISSTINVDLINTCFEWMLSDKQPIAVQSLSLKLLVRFCKIEPDLKPELIAYLENFDSDLLAPGMISSRRNALKELNKNLLHKPV